MKSDPNFPEIPRAEMVEMTTPLSYSTVYPNGESMLRVPGPEFFGDERAALTSKNPCHSSWTVLAKLPWASSHSGTRPTPAW